MIYAALKHVHVTTVGITLALLVLRARWRATGDPRLEARWVRIVPHANDTVLLASAVAMLAVAQLNPLQAPWLLAKIGALTLYIGLGVCALRPGRSPASRCLAMGGALAVFGYIVMVALTKRPVPWG